MRFAYARRLQLIVAVALTAAGSLACGGPAPVPGSAAPTVPAHRT